MKYLFCFFMLLQINFKCHSMDNIDLAVGFTGLIPTVMYGAYLSERANNCLVVADKKSIGRKQIEIMRADLDINLPITYSSISGFIFSSLLGKFKLSTVTLNFLKTLVKHQKTIRKEEAKLEIQGISFWNWLRYRRRQNYELLQTAI